MMAQKPFKFAVMLQFVHMMEMVDQGGGFTVKAVSQPNSFL